MLERSFFDGLISNSLPDSPEGIARAVQNERHAVEDRSRVGIILNKAGICCSRVSCGPGNAHRARH